MAGSSYPNYLIYIVWVAVGGAKKCTADESDIVQPVLRKLWSQILIKSSYSLSQKHCSPQLPVVFFSATNSSEHCAMQRDRELLRTTLLEGILALFVSGNTPRGLRGFRFCRSGSPQLLLAFLSPLLLASYNLNIRKIWPKKVRLEFEVSHAP